MPRGEHFHTLFRTSNKQYTERPPANCRTARNAWDFLARRGEEAGNGRVKWLRLLDGYWGCEFENGEFEDVENCAVNRKHDVVDPR